MRARAGPPRVRGHPVRGARAGARSFWAEPRARGPAEVSGARPARAQLDRALPRGLIGAAVPFRLRPRADRDALGGARGRRRRVRGGRSRCGRAVGDRRRAARGRFPAPGRAGTHGRREGGVALGRRAPRRSRRSHGVPRRARAPQRRHRPASHTRSPADDPGRRGHGRRHRRWRRRGGHGGARGGSVVRGARATARRATPHRRSARMDRADGALEPTDPPLDRGRSPHDVAHAGGAGSGERIRGWRRVVRRRFRDPTLAGRDRGGRDLSRGLAHGGAVRSRRRSPRRARGDPADTGARRGARGRHVVGCASDVARRDAAHRMAAAGSVRGDRSRIRGCDPRRWDGGGGTAALVGAMLAGEPPPFDPSPFDPLRFG